MEAPGEPNQFAVYYRRMNKDDGQWQAIERLSPPQHNTNRPQVDVDLAGNPHVVWYDVGEEEVYYTMRQANGWTTPENVSKTPSSIVSNLIISQGPTLAVDAANQPHIAWMGSVSKTQLDSIDYATHTASGWLTQTVMSRPDLNHNMQLVSGVNAQILSRGQGNLHLLWHDLDEKSALKIYTSNNLGRFSGNPWSSPTIITPDGLNGFHAGGYLDPLGQLHVTWTGGEASNQIYYQKLARFDWIKIVDESGRALPNTRVYRNGQLAGYADSRGLLLLDGLNKGDELVAIAPVAEYSGERAGHTSPDSATNNWAYRIYLTNWKYDANGNRVGEPALVSNGEQLLVVHNNQPLILLNLVVSLEWAASEADLQILKEALSSASTYLFDVTNGQIAIGNVSIYTAGQFWADADIQVRAFNDIRPNAGINGIRTLATTPVRIGRSWSGETGDSFANGKWNLPNGFRTIVHELGHYVLGLWDSYFLETRDENGNLKDQVDAYCTSKEIKTNSLYTTNATIMDYQYNASELSMQGTTSWNLACQKTQQYTQNHESDWETVRRLFEDRTNPKLKILSPYTDIHWHLQTPLETGVIAGPTYFPLSQTPTISIVAPITTTETPLQVVGPSASTQFALTTLYVHQTGGTSAIDQGYTDQNGQITILGAKDGDKVRVLSRDTSFHGELTLQAGVANTLTLTLTNPEPSQARTSQENVDSISNELGVRYVRILPKTDNRSLDIQVVGVPVGASLAGELAIAGTKITASTTLGYSNLTHEYRGQLVPAFTLPGQTLDGLVHVRVIGSDVNGAPFYLASGLSLAPIRPGMPQMISSANGALRLILSANGIHQDVGDVTLLLAEHNWSDSNIALIALSPVYQIRLSGSIGTFNEPTIVAILPDRVLANNEQPYIAYFDESTETWLPLPTSWDTENKIASTATTKTGFFALFLYQEITPTPTDTPHPITTSTPTPTNTPTLTATPTPTVTSTSTSSPTIPATLTATPTMTATATASPDNYSIYLPVIMRE